MATFVSETTEKLYTFTFTQEEVDLLSQITGTSLGGGEAMKINIALYRTFDGLHTPRNSFNFKQYLVFGGDC